MTKMMRYHCHALWQRRRDFTGPVKVPNHWLTSRYPVLNEWDLYKHPQGFLKARTQRRRGVCSLSLCVSPHLFPSLPLPSSLPPFFAMDSTAIMKLILPATWGSLEADPSPVHHPYENAVEPAPWLQSCETLSRKPRIQQIHMQTFKL